MRDILATIPLLLLVPALLVPFLSVGASGYTASLNVSGTAVPGGSLTLSGTGFPSKEWIDLRWDGAPTGVSVRVDSRNTFSGQLSVPAGAAAGAHLISAYSTGRNGKSGAEELATVPVQVGNGSPAPTATPLPTAPSPSSTPVPTTAPVATPTPTPVATPTPTISAPRIVSVSTTSLTQTSATIVWTVSEGATGQVEYGKTTAYGTFSKSELSYTWSTHVQTLSGLLAGTTYNFRVLSRTAAGVSLVSSNSTFTTLGSAPSPTPTPTPTSTPTPSPTPTPMPITPSTSRPFPAPVTTRTVNVPSTINATGTIDVTSALASFINSVPNGSVISFPANAVYRVTNGIYLRARTNLVLEGNGTTLKVTGNGTSTAHSGFKLDTLNADIAIRNFKVIGANPNTTTVYNASAEAGHGVLVWDSQRIEIDRVQVSHVYGDGMYVGGKNTSPYRPSQDIWVHNSSFDYVGRMGFVPNAVRNAVIENNTFNHVGLILLDVEPNHSWEIVDGVYFRDNQVGSYAMSGHQTNWFFAAAAAPGTVSNVYVERNHVSVGPSVNTYNPAGKGGLATRADRSSRLRNLVFRNNTTTVPGKPVSGYPGILYFAHIDGLIVTGNVQPVISGTLASINDSTAVNFQP